MRILRSASRKEGGNGEEDKEDKEDKEDREDEGASGRARDSQEEEIASKHLPSVWWARRRAKVQTQLLRMRLATCLITIAARCAAEFWGTIAGQAEQLQFFFGEGTWSKKDGQS